MKKNIKMPVLILVLVFVLFNLITLLVKQTKTVMVSHGVLENTFRATGYIFKDEILIFANDGVLKPIAEDGERVKKGARIGAILTSNTDEGALYEHLRIEDRIKKLAEIESANTETLRTDEQLTSQAREIMAAALNGNLSSIGRMKDSLLRFKDEKTAADGKKDALMETLKARSDALKPKIGDSIKEIYSPEAGILFLQTDGLEETMLLKATDNLTPSTLESLVSKPDGKRTSCKIMKSGEWRLAFTTDEVYKESLKAGNSLRLRMHDIGGVVISTDILSVSEPEDGKITVCVSSYQAPKGLLSRRRLNVEVVLGRYEGLKIPPKAVQEEDGQKGVYVKTVTSEVFKPIDILYENASSVIIKEDTTKSGTLRLYDTVIF